MKVRRTFYVLTVFVLVSAFLTGCYGHRHGDPDFPKRMLEHIDDHVEDLMLTENQNDQYLQIRSRLEADLLKQRESHRTFKTELIAVIDNQESGVKEITAKIRTKSVEIPGIVELYLNYVDEFYDILDEQQKAIVMAEIRDKADSRFFRR